MATVSVGSRLHFGFQNLSLARDRLYGGIGVATATPRTVVEATTAGTIECEDEHALPYVRAAVEALDVAGASVRVHERTPRHAGFGSGTRLALAALVAIASAYDRSVDVRALAPQLGRGGRSGVGIATFQQGGFVVDGGHPTERFTAEPPAEGDWSVPPVIARHDVPDDWRFVLVVPSSDSGPSGEREDESIRSVVERADPGIADEIASLLTQRVLPAIVEGDRRAFGSGIARLGRLNGAWYADEQGGVYRPPAGTLIEHLSRSPVVSGVGQSSWGPTVYGLTNAEYADDTRSVAIDALETVDVSGSVQVVEPDNEGVRLTD